MPGARCQVPGSRYQVPGPRVRCKVSGGRCQVLGVLCQVPDNRCQVPDVRCQVQHVRCQVHPAPAQIVKYYTTAAQSPLDSSAAKWRFCQSLTFRVQVASRFKAAPRFSQNVDFDADSEDFGNEEWWMALVEPFKPIPKVEYFKMWFKAKSVTALIKTSNWNWPETKLGSRFLVGEKKSLCTSCSIAVSCKWREKS